LADGRHAVSLLRWIYPLKRWMYRTGRPGRLARVMLRMDVRQFSSGTLSLKRAMTLEVAGRRTGKLISVPVIVADHKGERYLVAMLGKNANWVGNVRAAGGQAVLRRGHAEHVRLEEVDVGERPPILRRYLALAPGARPHFPVGRNAPVEDFAKIAAGFPVFHIVATDGAPANLP
jgi:deazaflavin-dependent oxidoreductase (nitroreductase family)